MARPLKPFLEYADLVQLLIDRGMDVGDPALAESELEMYGYYRLSGYFYPFRKLVGSARASEFFAGTTLSDVIALYRFDQSLRTVTFKELCTVEVMVRTRIGHELGRVSPTAHLKLDEMSSFVDARRYARWLTKYNESVRKSREDFVAHHWSHYGGVLPVWAAVEVLDWGDLAYLFEFSPRQAQDAVAQGFELTAPQLRTWLKSLNQLRNTCAHHGRLFNRVAQIVPKLPRPGTHAALDEVAPYGNRTFGQLSLLQYLLKFTVQGRSRLLERALVAMPQVKTVPASHVGMPAGWQDLRLWEFTS